MIQKGLKFLKQYKILVIVGGTIILLIIFYIILFQNYSQVDIGEEVFPEEIKPNNEEHKNSKNIKVDIKGAVNIPGVYELISGSRVEEAIIKSGGMRDEADTQYINLSKVLKDEMVIIIYTKEEIEKMTEGNTTIKYIDKICICPTKQNDACLGNNKITNQKKETESEETGPININTAELLTLQKLTGIGEAKAKLIVEYRKQKPFETIEDIKNVKGIGDAIFAKIKDQITV